MRPISRGQPAEPTASRASDSIDLSIRTLAAGDETAWRVLWDQYLAFYETTLEPEVTDFLWHALASSRPPYIGLAATIGDDIAGFAHVITHPVTFSACEAAYLEDLFVAPDYRRRGVASALIEHLLAIADLRRLSRVYWNTRADNLTARRLYDSFIPADDAVRYRICLS